ncbi:PqiC family protein [Burkholderia sp. IMCC1007]|uniref:PqiC family protein n=1 Tax=Burkholderia sp. IMCC1007 TaxID=3004104 RepID=UPI0022B48C6B|nr:PqiC family protein [Burkholderia sp. IMCC1007]
MIRIADRPVGTFGRKRSTWAAAALVAVLTGTLIPGCGHSPPTRYVALSAMPASAPLASEPVAPVQLTAVHIPAELDRLEVVTQFSANRLAIDDGARWGAPLGPMMRQTLAQDLLTRLPGGAFVLPDAPRPPDTRTLVVTVLAARPDANGVLTFDVAWTVLSGRPARVTLSRETTLTSQMADRDAAAQAAALSRILGQLADQIVGSLPAR